MNNQEFRKHAHELVDWIADYMDGVRDYPVRSQVEPGEIAAQLSEAPPVQGESFEQIFDDFQNIIMPGITHWQHPRFFAYFPANSTPESQLAEMLISALGVNNMLWETSPAATELEEKTMAWLGQMVGIPSNWSGVIQDTASSATFCAILAAREKATNWQVNKSGLYQQAPLKFYVTREAHSSIEKAMKMAGLGAEHIHFVATNDDHSMNVQELERAIQEDRNNGFVPTGIIACIGATGMGAIDSLNDIGQVVREEGLYLHVDAAWAGSALILEEYQELMTGIEHADSFVFNPHKWMGIQFDCSAHFVRNKESLIRTLTIMPEYLKSNQGVTDYRDWGIQLGRRMRALKVWFVLRGQGTEQVQQRIRNHIQWAEKLANIISNTEGFELVTQPRFALFTFKAVPQNQDHNAFNDELIKTINDDGYTYLTRTVINGQSVIRWSIGHTNCTWEDVESSWEKVKALAATLLVR